MRVLVTGGCGFIGASLVPMLNRRGWEVTVFDDLSTGRADRVPDSVRVVEGSITDLEAVCRAASGVDAVVHLAAMASVLESVKDPWPSFEANVRGTLTVLEQSRVAGVGCVVFASSNAALGDQGPPITEDLPPRPVSPYGATKAAGEAYCSAYAESHSLRTVCLRFANAYGPHCEHKTSVVPKFFRALLRRSPITIYGDGQQTRDFVFVEDICRSIEAAIDFPQAKGIYQIATGVETSVHELVNQMRNTSGIEPRLAHAPQPSGEIRRNYSSIDRARRDLHFVPTTNLGAGLGRTWDWMRCSTSFQSVEE